MDLTVDIEPTNRCNASCHFCPRDATPHQGLMTPDVFDQALLRAIEFRDDVASGFGWNMTVSLCGLGEPLLNKHAPTWVSQVKQAGFPCVMSSNGALLNEKRGTALLEAGLDKILINIGDEGEEYERVYKLPFEKSRDNVARFAEMAGDDCEVHIVLVDHRHDRDHLRRMVKYWQGYGLSKFVFFDVMNRGGALFVDHMQFDEYPELEQARAILAERDSKPACGAPFGYMFVGYDGKYYLCCSDWKKEVPMGTVFEASIVDVTSEKLQHVMDRRVVCATCNLDPLNRVTEGLRSAANGDEIDTDQLIDGVVSSNSVVWGMLEQLEQHTTIDYAAAERAAQRTRIPVKIL
ncbi:MAG: radical SAM protein [Acidimicrobiia bacterium]|nr:radical SAM protein [Acidimicrobiia bacterium]MDH5238643.1 radical SAM protein [Acidimicrobiia bacterium]